MYVTHYQFSFPDCGELPAVDNGILILLNESECRGCQAILKCDSGYDPCDPRVITCVKTGKNSTWVSASCMIKGNRCMTSDNNGYRLFVFIKYSEIVWD